MRHCLIFFLIFMACLSVGAQPIKKITGDSAIIGAKKAFEKKDLSAFTRLDAQNHILAPYVTYWYLRTAFEKDSAHLGQYEKMMRTFVESEQDGPLAQPLLSAWLKALGKQKNWIYFAMDYPIAGEDIELRCYGISYRYDRDGVGALAAGKTLWLTGKSLPKSCDDVISAMVDKGILTHDDIVARFRLASENGNTALAKSLWRMMVAKEKTDEKTFTQAERQPLKYLATKPTPKDKGAAYLLFYALENAARKDVATAWRSWLLVRDAWPQAEQAHGNARLAFRAARQLHPDASRYYKDVDNALLDVTQRIWRIRAALHAGNYMDALNTIAVLPEDERVQDVWRYWRARGLEKQGTEEAAGESKKLYESLAREESFYGMLAAERLGQQKLALAHQPLAVSEETIDAFLKKPVVRRIVKLNALDMRTEMLREWRPLVRSLNEEELHVAAQAMWRMQIVDRAIAAADRTQTRHDYTLRYPRPFEKAFADASSSQGIDVDWLYAVARQESRFIPEIVSSAGAVGLMQLMPGTARWVARKLSVEKFKTADLNDAAMNTVFGAFYLRHCLDDLDNSLALAAAAYNAGPGRAKRWRDALLDDGDVWVETIPFEETRDYVKKVLSNTKIYAQLNGNSFSIVASLNLVVAPPDTTTNDPLTDGIDAMAGSIENVAADEVAKVSQ